MSPFLASALSNLLSAAIWDVALVPAYGAMRDRAQPSRFDKAARLAGARIADELGPMPEAAAKALATLLHDPAVRTLVRDMYAWRVDRPGAMLQEVEAAFVALWRRSEEPLPAELTPERAFGALVAGCEQVLDDAIDRNLLAAHEARSAARDAAALERLRFHDARSEARAVRLEHRLSSIERQIARLEALGPRRDAPADVERQIRRAVAARCATIAPPSFHSAPELQLDAIYVRPSFRWRDPLRAGAVGEGLTYPQLVERLDRVVLLGAPGAGKSTLAQQLCRDLALERYRVRGELSVCPVLVELRAYAAAQRDGVPLSVRDYVAATLRGDLQLDEATEQAIERLLWEGRMLVVFDGLDEVAGPATRLQLRRQIVAFADRYPVRVVVTSRAAGYDDVPLSVADFAVAAIELFDRDRARSYVTKWMTATGRPHPRTEAAALMSALEHMHDLYENPLMLALICMLSREGGLPDSRVSLYRDCADMLYDEWDRKREIDGLGDLQDRLRPVLGDVALWLLEGAGGDPAAASEDRLRQRVRAYIAAELYDGDMAAADRAARLFVEFCRGRAWIFSDTAIDKGGIPRFGFTHRSFLEYFAAERLVLTRTTPEQLAATLRPRLARGEWGLVPELAAMLLERAQPGGCGPFVRELLPRVVQRVPHDKVLAFAVRMLALVPLDAEAIDVIVERVMFETLSDLGDPSKLPRDHFEAREENAVEVRRAWARHLSPLMMRTPVSAADLLIRWPARVGDAAAVRAEALEGSRQELLALAEDVFQIAYDCCLLGWRELDWFVRTWSVGAVLRPRSGGLWESEPPLLHRLVAGHLPPGAATSLVAALIEAPTPWFGANELWPAVFGTTVERFLRTGPPGDDSAARALWTVLACVAVERVSDDLSHGRRERITRRDGALLRSLRVMAQENPAAQAIVARADSSTWELSAPHASGGLPPQLDALVSDWAAGAVSLVEPQRADDGPPDRPVGDPVPV